MSELLNMNIAGAGGGKDGGSPRVAVEQPDNLRSSQYANLIDVLCEGEIEGLVDGLRSIYLNGTPIQGAGSQMNFTGVSMVSVNGQQEQNHLPFAPVTVSQAVDVELNASAPTVQTVSNPEADWVKVTLGVPRLTYQNPENGDISGTSVSYRIDVQANGGGYVTVVSDTIAGKTNSRYQREHKIYLSGTGPWNIRVARTSPNSTQSNLINSLFWDVLTTGIDVKLKYPNTAAVMLRLDAKQFSSVPTRGYKVRGLKVRVPNNYDPITRTYSGAWNGTFKIAWTNNPAWCFYDLITNARYGLGDYISVDQVDKWALYEIGRYCDELVPDGFGGTEPRFACNLFLQTQEEAFKVITSMASIFRGMAFWSNDQVTATQDAPSDPVALFTAANVIDGGFNYQGADRRARHSVVLVSWNDPTDQYRQKIEYVADDAAIARWGVVQTEIVAIGCTSRGQAHRVGKWLLYTEQNESETISFRAGMDAVQLQPGSVFATHDSIRSGKRLGGRIVSASVTEVTIDAPIEIQDGQSYELSVVMPNGDIQTRFVTNGPGTHSTLTVNTPFTQTPDQFAVWVVSASNAQTEYWRAITITEVEPTIVEVSAVAHNPSKYDAIEQGLSLETRVVSSIPTRPGPVTNVVSETEMFLLNNGNHSTRISLGWKAPEYAATYRISWRRDSDNYKTIEINTPSYDIENVAAGTFTIKIAALNALGTASDVVEIQHIVNESAIAPDVTGLSLNPNFTGQDMPLKWDAVPGATAYELEIRDSGTNALLRTATSTAPAFIYTYAMNVTDGGPRRSLKVRLRAKTLVGVSANWVEQTFANPAPAAPSGLAVEAGPGQVSIFAERPSDPDLAGMIVWMYTDATVPAIEANKIYQGTDNAYMKTGLPAGQARYFRVAFYDAFGTAGLNTSSTIAATPLASGGVTKVTSLPANPTAVGGELAVFLDVADSAQRGLYGWNGTAWVSVSALLDDSVTSDKLAPGAVDFTALAAAAVQAKNLAVKKHFIY